MFNTSTQIPRSPLASTLTILFHVCLGLLVVLVTALPSIPREHKTESLTYMVAEPLPDLRFEIPKPTPPPTPAPKLEVPKPEPPKPKLEAPLVERPTPPAPPPPPERRIAEPPKEIPVPKPAVTVGAFADATPTRKPEKTAEVAAVNFDSATSATAKTRREVQTIDGFESASARTTTPRATVSDAGFGASAPTTTPRAGLTTANAGFSADTTPRPAASAPRTTAAAGFGSDAAAKPAPAAPKPPTQAAGFADAPPTAPRPAPQAPPPPRADRPVEVLYKPTPGYTDDARAQHIEGEVMLEVEFSAAGQVRVIRVVHGLGHGLDEMAQRAAEQIRFKPATSKGTPVDFRANLTILFRLT